MVCVVQRVTSASVTVGGQGIALIGPGILALVAVHIDDTPADILWTASKLVGLRIFPNADKKFDLDVAQAGGSILLVSNFTVAASTRKGRRPSLDPAAGPEMGQRLFDALVREIEKTDVPVETGRFGADMQVQLTNDGPVTFLLNSLEARHE